MDILLQGMSRRTVLDDLADALPLETWAGPFTTDGGAGEIQTVYGGDNVTLEGDFADWEMTFVWDDHYQSGLKDGPRKTEIKIDRGLHVNVRIDGRRTDEIGTQITTYFARQTQTSRDWKDDRVRRARGKSVDEQVRKTTRGTSWLQDSDPGADGYIETRRTIFAGD